MDLDTGRTRQPARRLRRACIATLTAVAVAPLPGQSVWEETGTSQFGRQGAAMVYDSQRGRAVVFGGYRSGYLGDTLAWDGATWTRVASTGPSPRLWPAMAYDSARDRVVLFGGLDANSNSLGGTWEWDGTSWALVASSGPSPRYRAAMAYDSRRGRVLMYGGNAPNFDTWAWDGRAWTIVDNAGPGWREGSAMVYDPDRDRVVLFGGLCNPTYLGDTWEWDGNSWTLMTNWGPQPRYGHAMAYDALRRRVVLFGGGGIGPGAGYLGDTQEWSNGFWTQLSTTGPEPRFDPAMVYAGRSGRLVLFGGVGTTGNYNTTYPGETWESLVPGARFFGASSPGCNGPLAIGVTSVPRVGSPAFSIVCDHAPPMASGGLLIGATGLGTPVSVLGVEIWVSSFLLAASTGSNALGQAAFALPIPANPALVGTRFSTQFLWSGPSSPPPCPPFGLSASNALEIDIRS